jgi:hypothetical protein
MLQRIFVASAFVGISLCAGAAAAYDRNPVGERADYELDRNAGRTSSLIQNGTLALYITQHLPDQQGGAVYETKLDYDFRLRYAGRQQGRKGMSIPLDYFTPDFMADLRRTGHYESVSFKVDHLGYGDAQNLDGHRYENCDKIRIYDIKDLDSPFVQVALELLEAAVAQPIDDLVIVAHIKDGEPVLGAVKLDIAGKYSGLSIKAGADFRQP